VPCMLTLIALTAPRLVIVLVWMFSSWFAGLFPNLVVPMLGFLFLPTTLLWYTAVQHWYGGQWSFWPLVGLAFALMFDVSPASGRKGKSA
jgi:hypothetical protein